MRRNKHISNFQELFPITFLLMIGLWQDTPIFRLETLALDLLKKFVELCGNSYNHMERTQSSEGTRNTL